jgi:uncharacterized protein YndB with AHSA1/START domain
MNSDTQAATTKAATLSTPTEREIVTERVFDAPRERVWRAFTDPELIPKWWGLHSMTTVVAELELRPGGRWRFVQRGGDGEEAAFRGVYREVTAPERLVYTFEWEGMPGHVLVDTATFEDLGDQTKLLVESLFHTSAERDGMLSGGMERGLNESYAMLDELLAVLASA